MRIGARTRVFALLGDPVGHSLSPLMQNAGFLAAGLDAVYVALAVTEAGLAAQMATLVRSGGGGNVTIPFKEAAAIVPAGRDARVTRLGSANVFGGENGGLHVGNTDVDGILAALDAVDAASNAWWIVGTGGSARAAVGAAIERGARVAVQSRDASRAETFRAWAASLGAAGAERAECGVVINATPVGLAPRDAVPIDVGELHSGARVVDLVYRGTGPTPLVQACNDRGIPAIDGREVLLVQGAASWKLWFPTINPPLEVMRAALDGRLG